MFLHLMESVVGIGNEEETYQSINVELKIDAGEGGRSALPRGKL